MSDDTDARELPRSPLPPNHGNVQTRLTALETQSWTELYDAMSQESEHGTHVGPRLDDETVIKVTVTRSTR